MLGLFLERKKRPRRANKATKITMVLISRLCGWKDALVVVKPQTLIRWHRQGFKLLWRWKSRPGRPPISDTARRLIAEMAKENPLWSEERIAHELLLKTGIEVSPRTVRKYMPQKPNVFAEHRVVGATLRGRPCAPPPGAHLPTQAIRHVSHPFGGTIGTSFLADGRRYEHGIPDEMSPHSYDKSTVRTL